MDKETIGAEQVCAAVERVAVRMRGLGDLLNGLDAAVGDGDLGITAVKGATALTEYVATKPPGDDLGAFLSGLGMAFNRAASSTFGALTATALMRMGKELKGLARIDVQTLAKALSAANAGVQERGKARPGDKTLVDVLHPAAESFAAAVAEGKDLHAAAASMLSAARTGRDSIVALQSRIGRASWVGERTRNQPDPGAVLLVEILQSITGDGPEQSK
jgi:phosphoenolpyruvate---glycerone phosphotransferase subunit DhaL